MINDIGVVVRKRNRNKFNTKQGILVETGLWVLL